jgi:hypothetical protein
MSMSKLQLPPDAVALFKLTVMFDKVHCACTLELSPTTAKVKSESKIFFMLQGF